MGVSSTDAVTTSHIRQPAECRRDWRNSRNAIARPASLGLSPAGERESVAQRGGTARLEGASGEGTMIWRPSAVELKKQLDGATLDNATGILLWRDFKLKGR